MVVKRHPYDAVHRGLDVNLCIDVKGAIAFKIDSREKLSRTLRHQDMLND